MPASKDVRPDSGRFGFAICVTSLHCWHGSSCPKRQVGLPSQQRHAFVLVTPGSQVDFQIAGDDA